MKEIRWRCQSIFGEEIDTSERMTNKLDMTIIHENNIFLVLFSCVIIVVIVVVVIFVTKTTHTIRIDIIIFIYLWNI